MKKHLCLLFNKNKEKGKIILILKKMCKSSYLKRNETNVFKNGIFNDLEP